MLFPHFVFAEDKPLMKAIVAHEYGGPEVLNYEDVPRPEPKENQILLRVIAAGVDVRADGDGHFFRIDIAEAVITRLNSGRTGLVIESWTAVRGYRVFERT